MQRRQLLRVGAASAAVLAAPMIKAQSLPSGPMRIVVGFPPGGGTDALARVLAQKLQAMWNINIVIDNKAGAAGVIAADYVAKQPADGNTLLMAHINSHALATSLQPKLGYNVERDFSPIGLVGVTPNLLICNENQPAKTVKDLVALCKQNPGKISFASAGGGSAQHLALEMFKLRAGIDALHVPYKGSSGSVNDLVSGQVSALFSSLPSLQGLIDKGYVRVLAATSRSNSPATKNLPLMSSTLQGFDYATWYAMYAPIGTSKELVERINKSINQALKNPKLADKVEAAGTELHPGTPQEVIAWTKRDADKWVKVIRVAKISVE